jgi:hypothetical protein
MLVVPRRRQHFDRPELERRTMQMIVFQFTGIHALTHGHCARTIGGGHSKIL